MAGPGDETQGLILQRQDTPGATLDESGDSVSGDVVVHNPAPGQTLKRIHVTGIEVDRADAAAAIQNAISSSPNRTIVSSDIPEVLAAAVEQGARENQGLAPENSKVAIMPFGGAVNRARELANGANQYLRTFASERIEAAKADKIGLVVVTFGLGVQHLNWICATNVSNLSKALVIGYSTFLWFLFEIDKPSFQNATRPIQDFYKKVLKLGDESDSKAWLRKFIVEVAPGATLMTAMNLGMVPLLSLDKFWTNTFDAAAMGVAMAVAGLPWNKLVAQVDAEATPKARFLANRAYEVRKGTIAVLASSVFLLDFAHHGLGPWFALSMVGAAGMPLLLNRQALTDFIEKSPTIDRIFKEGNRRAEQVRSALAGAGQMCKAIHTRK
jgi:hypothetical protein